MNRRRFLIHSAATAALASVSGAPLSVWGMGAGFNGDFLIYIQASGGWDVTSYCDPKVNIEGKPIINNWAQTAGVQSIGNLAYAPVADNAAFFQDHYEKLLVINGINVKTNSHSAGTQYTHTGSIRAGNPHLAALYAYEKALGMAMPVIATSRFSSAGLLPPTLIDRQILDLINPNLWSLTQTQQYLPSDDLASIRALREYQAEAIESATPIFQKQQRQIGDYLRAVFTDTNPFNEFSDYYAGLDHGKYIPNSYIDSIRFALTAFKVGLGVAADMYVSGFDSHANHDADFEVSISKLNNLIGCTWHYAEQLGIADRLLVVVASDFGRTPHYNADAGKDHWPYGSTMVMKKNASWTNRAVGFTDAGHVGARINPQTLSVDTTNGEEIEPKHVMQALRHLLGVSDSDAARRFDLEIRRPFNFFNV